MLCALYDLEKYINADDDLDALLRAALIHYQFETIHPILDGNVTLRYCENVAYTEAYFFLQSLIKLNNI